MPPAKEGSLPQSSSGYVAVAPFELEGGGVVGVMMGWLPKKLEADAGAEQKTQRIVAVLREEEERNRHTPLASIAEGLFFAATSEDLARAWGVNEPLQLVELVQELPPPAHPPLRLSPLPRSIDVYTNFRTTPQLHSVYAATWFSCSIAWCFLVAKRFIFKR
jgi:cytochrome oxidase assembly protein ShyY1